MQKLDAAWTKTEQCETRAADPEVLKELDSSDFEATRVRTGCCLRSRIKHADWPRTIAAWRARTGKRVKREFTSRGFGNSRKGAPAARHVILMHRSDYGAQKVDEQVALVHEGEECKLAGYFVRQHGSKR